MITQLNLKICQATQQNRCLKELADKELMEEKRIKLQNDEIIYERRKEQAANYNKRKLEFEKYEAEFDKYMELTKAKMLKFEMSNIHELFNEDDEETIEKTPQTVADKKDVELQEDGEIGTEIK